MPEPAYSIIERNLRVTMQFFGTASGAGDITESGDVLMIDSGVNYSVFNIAMLSAPVTSRGDLQDRIRTAAAYFEKRKTRWSFWLCDEMLDQSVRKKSADAFWNGRLRILTEAPGMIAHKLLPPVRPLPEIECRRVDDTQTRTDFAHLTSVSFDIPFATCRMIYQPEEAWNHDYIGYVGYVNGTAVCTTALVHAADALGVYSVSTLPASRRKGYAEALMRQALEQYGRATGTERSVLQATRAGYHVYYRMGYRDASRFTVYVS